MRALKVLNTIALGIPIFIGLFGLIDEVFLIYAAISTMATGFIQVVIGIIYWCKFPKSSPIKIYFVLLSLFFLILLTKIGDDWVWFLPLFLCVYLSVLIFSKPNQK